MRARWVLSLAVMQLGWVACVLGAARGHPWVGPAFVLSMLALHVGSRPAVARGEIVLLGAAAALGLVVDGSLLRAHVMAIAGARLPPMWLLMLWPNVAAATAPGGSLGALAGRPLLGAIAGAVAAPFAYGAGARLGALTVDHARLFVIGVAWSGVMPVMLALRSRLATPTRRARPRASRTKGEP
jgi:hypothetical protein